MSRQRKLIKSLAIELEGIKKPSFDGEYKVVSHPSGNCPYFLLEVNAEDAPINDIIHNTADFYSNYDLIEGQEIELI